MMTFMAISRAHFMKLNIFTDEMWKINRNISDKYYPITRLWFVKSAMISLRHPDDLEVGN